MMDRFDNAPVIVGAGLAGLMTALEMAPRPVVVLAASPLGQGAASGWAQGGIAAAIGPDDSATLHAEDTLAAGAGLTDAAVARRIAEAGAGVIARLRALDAPFDLDADGAPRLGLEAAHRARRIIHAADATGAAVLSAVIAAVRAAPSIRVTRGAARRLLLDGGGAIAGVLAADAAGAAFVLPARRVVLATGGLGGLFTHSTNPSGAIGAGLALAARAGAALADMEFVQFHPTALDVGRDPMPLVSEAVRGEGAVLIDETGARFLAGGSDPRADLAPRDVVAAAVWRHVRAGHRVFLDARACLGDRFAARFPGIARACLGAGIDPARAPIPVRPAAHYHMGGIAVDAAGRSSVDGLYAVGEVASTGLHGANRLASNSLLEAAACARDVATNIAGRVDRPARAAWHGDTPPASDAGPVRPILSAGAGVLRDAAGLRAARDRLLELHAVGGCTADPALVALLIVEAALHRTESRGAHQRADYPMTSPIWAHRQIIRAEDVLPPALARAA